MTDDAPEATTQSAPCATTHLFAGSLLRSTILRVRLARLATVLNTPRLRGERSRRSLVTADEDVVEREAGRHGPDLHGDTCQCRQPVRVVVHEERGVCDLPCLPLADVLGVVNQRRSPLALVRRVGLVRPHPLTASRTLLTRRVRNLFDSGRKTGP